MHTLTQKEHTERNSKDLANFILKHVGRDGEDQPAWEGMLKENGLLPEEMTGGNKQGQRRRRESRGKEEEGEGKGRIPEAAVHV